MWNIVKQSSDANKINLQPATSRKGWKTIRLFVSSTFKDFHQEREVLVKEVFPDLRLWCEARKLRLVECDLRWGVPKDSTSEETIKICLSELDRCCEDNTAPFFLNLAGDRAGWIPKFEDFSLNLASQYGWVYGLSVTEMEIVHGAMRKLNPNALFLIRDIDGKENIPDDLKNDFEEAEFKTKLEKLKETISKTFPETNVKNYSVKCQFNSDGSIKLSGLTGEESEFSHIVYSFFQSKIEELYPLDESPMDPLQIQRDAHEMFLDSRSSCVLGRDKILQQIEDYVMKGHTTEAPLLVVGIAGAGKSALMAKSAHRATELVTDGAITMPGNVKKCRVFFHFVGATPRSTDLASFLQRLVKEINPSQKEGLSDLDSLISLSYNLLENESTEPVIVFVDAINQMDEDKQQYLNRWLPEKLSPNVRVVLSTIESTTSHQTIRAFKSSPVETICGPLDKDSRQAIVENILRAYNKRLHDDQMKVLLDKDGSSNPLWLTLACEELRVYGKFETLTDKIHELPDDLISLEETVFARFEKETGGELMKACVCMLEVSRHGLLETELLALLGEKKNVEIPEYQEIDEEALLGKTQTKTETTENIEETKQNLTKLVQETYVKDESKNEGSGKGGKKAETKVKFKRPKGKQINFLPARDWALIYRNLKPLLRPCGDLGEGRLDFYHRSLSKAARRRYFSGEEKIKKHAYNFWHGVLADYFEGVDDMDRKAEELPYHLENLLDNNRLIRCLMDWEVFNRLYSEEFSIDLLHAWRQCGGFGVASAVYKEQLAILRTSDMPLIEYVEIVENVYTFLIQAGQYQEAIELMEQRLNDELSDLGERPDEMADVYQNMARCKSEIDKAQQYITREQIIDNRQIVEYCRKCLNYRQQLPESQDNKYRCACVRILMAHHLSNIADLTGEMNAQNEAFKTIDEAIDVFTELNDMGHLAECKMTKGIIDYDKPFDFREPLLRESLSICMKAYGEHHLLTTRILLNTGIMYEMHGDYQKAFQNFKDLKRVCLAVFGHGHPKTVRAIKTISDPRYQRMLQAEERQAAGVA
ncbi:TPR repeat-containing protein DDB_G0287407-like isoform X2 [Clytia hemisphaerica]